MSRTDRLSGEDLHPVPTRFAESPDFAEVITRPEVAETLGALSELLEASLEVLLPDGDRWRYGIEASAVHGRQRQVFVAGTQLKIAFRGGSVTDSRVDAATRIVKGLLDMAYAVEDLSIGSEYLTSQLEQVLGIVSKTETWREIDAAVCELLRQLCGQFRIDRAFAVIAPIGANRPQIWLAKTAADVRVAELMPERWTRLRKEILDDVADRKTMMWPPDRVPASVSDIADVAASPAATVIARSLGTTGHHVGLVGVRTLPRTCFGSLETQWLDVLLTSAAGTISALIAYEDAARGKAIAARDAVTKASGMVAHKLGNPTAALLAQIGLCQKTLAASGQIEDLPQRLQKIRNCAQRIQDISRDFKNLLLPPVVHLEPLDLASLVDRVVSESIGPPHEVSIKPPSVVWGRLTLDAALCRSILEEVIANAVQATPQGGTIRVQLTGPHEAGQDPFSSMKRAYVTIAISDDGPGVPPDKRDEIFEPLVTSRAGGTGLGLAIVRRSVQLLNGDVRVDPQSPMVRGATFRIAFPVD